MNFKTAISSVGISARRLFFAFDSPWRRRLWDEMRRLAHANETFDPETGAVSYRPLTPEQSARLARIHWILGSCGRPALGLGFHHAFERLARKVGGARR